METVIIEITITGEALKDMINHLFAQLQDEPEECDLQDQLENAYSEGFEKGYDAGYADSAWEREQEEDDE